MNTISKLIKDIKNGTSHSVDYLLKQSATETISKRGIQIRKLLSPILRKIYVTQSKYKLVEPSRIELPKTEVGKIFVLNHRQADDIVLGVSAIGESGYLVFGNKYLALDTKNGLGLWAHGMILTDRNDKENRKSTYEKMKYVIENGGNIILWPEGYWNLADNGQKDERHGADDHNSENWLIQDINVGCVKLAKETGAIIVPTVLHYDEINGKKCYAKMCKPVYVLENSDIFEKKDEIVASMQDQLFYLMEKYSTYERGYLEEFGPLKEQWKKLKKELVADCDITRINYKLDLSDEKLIGKCKVIHPVTTNEEAFAHLEELVPKKENAFVYSKKLTGRRQ